MSGTQHAVSTGRFHYPWNRPGRPRRQFWRPGGWLALACLLGSGCYSTARVDVGPALAEATPDLRVDVSDQGRVALADRLGPGVLRIEGELVGATNDSMTIAVSRVSYL
ncbi:MAG TPA: hypothetical protein VHQ45_01500, partial [Gemmatimonadaceae bacterium]|nr:hypothetical protein [Gemmatimonadaceae bacterium]